MICDSPLECVTCSTHRLAERRADLQAALREAPTAVMVTLTTSHGHDALALQWIEFDKILAASLIVAKAQGRTGGRPPAVDAKKLDTIKKLMASGDHSPAEIARMVQISPATLCRVIATL